MERFYKLHVATRKKLGVFPQPYSFFKSIFRHVISQSLGFITTAECEGKTIAGAVFLTYDDTIYYKYNASDKKYLDKRPNNLIIWEAIKYACENNFRYFDFGRCAPGEEGLRAFKARWGAREMAVPYYYFPDIKGFNSVKENSVKYQAMRLFSNIMPQRVCMAVGSLLYKHIG
jgi:CelD/BcsL family acetyltransferase involved in cellulose biosynthesis